MLARYIDINRGMDTIMKQRLSLTIVTMLVGLFLLEDNAIAQRSNDNFRGISWKLISGKVVRGGRTLHLTAPRAGGFLVFDGKDHFLLVITRSGSLKVTGRVGQAGNSSENKDSLQKNVACFGTYSVDDKDQTINVHIEESTFPKWVGTNQKRRFTVVGDRLKLWDDVRATELIWERVN